MSATTDWKNRVINLRQLLGNLTNEVRDLLLNIPDDEPQKRLQELVPVWQVWNLDSQALTESPAQGAYDAAYNWCPPSSQKTLAETAGLFAKLLEQNIAALLSAGCRHADVVGVGEFGPDGLSFLTAPGGFKKVVLGRVSALPVGHPLTSLPAYYKITGEDYVILGAARGTTYRLESKPWYDVAGVRYLAAAWVAQQQREEQQRLLDQERERAFRQAARQNDPTARMQDRVAQLEKVVANLQARGPA
jgi:hypothetical protein